MDWHELYFLLWLADWTDDEIAEAYGTTAIRVEALRKIETGTELPEPA